MSFRFAKINFNGDPNVGLYGFASDEYCILGARIPKLETKIKDVLKVDLYYTTISGTELAGIFSAGNKYGIILPKIIRKDELNEIKSLGLNVLILESKETALGNLILCNDKGVLISDKLKSYKKEIQDNMNCETEILKMKKFKIIGSVAVASNKGCLCHPETTEEEAKNIEDILKVKVDVGTVSFGSPFVKSGIIVNSKGILISESSTGPELGRMGEVFE